MLLCLSRLCGNDLIRILNEGVWLSFDTGDGRDLSKVCEGAI